MNANAEEKTTETAPDNQQEQKDAVGRSFENQNHKYSLEEDGFEQIGVGQEAEDDEEELEYQTKTVASQSQVHAGGGLGNLNGTSSQSSKEAISEEDEEEALDADQFEDSNNIGSYRLEDPTPPKAQEAHIHVPKEAGIDTDGGQNVLKRNYSDGALCVDDIPKGLSPEDAQTLK